MAEPTLEPIVKRIRHLSSLVSTSGLDVDEGSGISNRQLFGQEGLLDALLVLYDECNNDQLKKEKNIADFVDKYRSTVHDLRKIAFYEEERDIMAKATSPWITQLQYAFQDTQQLYLVMEFHPGGDLLSLLDRYDGCFPEDMTCFYLAEIILAVHALHSMGYVHRDLKPDNILIDRCGHIKLADFGSAAKLTTSGLVRSKMPVGTPDYIAPEVLQSLNEKAGSISYGIECDMWSLGIMAYEMCYGTMPFKGDKLVTTYSNIMNHKKMLKFEDDPENPTSDSAKDLIRGLLEDSSHRLNHSALLQHKFFLHVNWNDLRNSPPPFVPIVNGVDDTSNFEEFENEKRVPSVNDFRVQQGFTGKNLSFIGFTYNRKRRNGDGSSARNNAAALNISVLDESIREPSHLEAQLKAQKKENHELKLQLEGMKDGEFGRLMKSRDCKLKEAECRVEYLEKERQRLEEESLKRERDATTYKRVLALERADRAQTESKTIEMIRSMKNKWKNSEAEKLQALDNKISAYEEEIKWLQSQHQETKQEVLNQKEKEAVKCVGDCESAVESKKKLEEVLSKLETQEEEITNRRAELEKEKRQTNKFERIINEKEHIEEERKIVEEQLQELQGKFTKVEEDLAESRRHFQHAKELERLERQKRIDNLECQLNKEKKECSRLRHQLQEVSGQLNESMISLESVTSTHSLKEEEQEAKIKELEGELRRIASDKVNLQSQLMQVKAREGEHKSKIAELELLLSKLDETVHSLESKKSSTEAFEETYQAKLQLLETQLDSARAAHSQDKEKLKKLSDELTEVKQEISDSKLDVRVSQREVKSAQDTISYLREKTREQRGQLDEKEADIQKATEAANDLRKTIDQLENELKAKEEELDRQRIEHEHFVSNLEEKIKNLEEVKKSSEQYQKKLREANQQSDSLKLEKRGLESQIQMFEVTKEEVKQEKVAMQEKVNDLLEKLKHAELVISQLKQVCTDQDEELSIMESQSEQIAHHEQEMARLQQEIEKLEGDVKAAKAATNEEKSLKLFQESKVKELESRLNGVDEETDKQIAYLNNQLQESGKINLELHEQIENQDKELNEAMILLRSLERKYSELQGQYDLAKEESAGHIQHIHTLKDSNFKLTEGLEEAISKGELYKKRIEEVEQTLMDQQALLDDNKVKTKGTIDQQTKLIDFLQAKIDPKKKKNLKGKLFGGKENKENTSFSMPHQYRELEDLLVRERMTNKQLEEHLGKARAEIVALRANSGTLDNRSNMGTPRTARTPLVPRKPMPSHTPLLPATPQNKKAFHNIGLQMRAARCAGCLDSIPFARNGARCHECGIIAHNKCSQELPSTCGLPVQFAEHYSRGWTSDSPLKMRGSQSDSDILIQGWLKMPRSGKACWESCFVRLEEEEIMVFDHEPSNGMQPQSRTKLSRPGCLTAIMSAVPRSELPNTSNVDLPYVLKIEIRAKNMNENSDTLYLMTTNFEEKQSWVSALEGVVAQLPKEDGNNINQTDYIQTAMIGAAEGLYSFEVDKNGILKSRARIEGLTAVHQILLVEGAHVALFIAGTDNLVFMNDLRSLTVISEAMQLTKPNLSPARVEPLQGCHLLASGSTKAEEIFVCAAATDRISILLWNTLEEKFTVCRQYRTQEPCSCLHFTQASLIVGAEKFYEIDLKTFDIEEFLDESDTSLAYAIYGSAQMSSFPVAIMQISKPKKYEEYLLCFHEFAVFVDACGQRSREHDIKFTRLPIAIVFRNPCLYIIHQNAVEVIEIRPDCFTKVSAEADSDSDSSPPVRISSKNMARPSYLGPALTPDSILVASRGSEKLEVVQISANFPEDMDLNSTWGTLPSFSVKRNDTDNLSMNSITSGSSSENELTRYNKRVQFSQTQVPCKRSKSGT
ncbi:Citron Rho-interacting kinase-like [Homarus americanus]|uniref:non-specific serine/threonine protein kinase n=1 Tax=Homarus americanus TaxID=6706 RepID=A0A8J5KAH7_HOMAM|nr:Citron Rho-interacting kinase-like [Homarus americanus]